MSAMFVLDSCVSFEEVKVWTFLRRQASPSMSVAWVFSVVRADFGGVEMWNFPSSR
jgi:hypothetical protein